MSFLWATSLVGAVSAAFLPKYNETEAARYLEYSIVAFCDKGPVENWTCGPMCEAASLGREPSRVRFLGPSPIDNVQGYVATVEGSHCVVAFRGTIDWRNWLVDGRFMMAPWPTGSLERQCDGCRVHTGFARAFAELSAEMMAALTDIGCESVTFTGHSLGAALTELASMYVRLAMPTLKVTPLYTFGAPRLGNAAFARAFNAAMVSQGSNPVAWRVVHYHDPVPLLPPRWKLNFTYGIGLEWVRYYWHTGLEVWYDEAFAQHQVCQSVDDDQNPNCSLSTSKFEMVNTDHIHYFNKSTAHKSLPESCTLPAPKVASGEDVTSGVVLV